MLLNVLYPFKLIDSRWLNDSFYLMHALASGFFVLFTLEFLDVRKYMPRLDKILRCAAWLYICIMPTLNTGVVELSPFTRFVLVIYGGITITIVCFLVGIFRLWQGNHQAHFYLLAYLIYSISHYRICYVSIVHIEPPGIMVVQWLYGFTLEVIILTVALSDRFFSMRKEKEHAQQRAYAEAKAFDQSQRSYTQSLHRQVDQQTTALRLANKKKDELFQVVGDNLRAPLRKVTDLSNRIDHLPGPENEAFFRNQLQNIQLISFNLLNHLENLLQWARMKVECLPFNPKKYNLLNDIVHSILEKYQLFIQKNQIKLFLDIDKQLHVYVDLHAITVLLRHLIVYITSNLKDTDLIVISALRRNSRIRVTIEYTYSGSNILRTNDPFISADFKQHFSIQLCRQLLHLHGSQLDYTITEDNRILFGFELEEHRTTNFNPDYAV